MEGGGASGREHLKAPAPPQQDLGPSLPGVQPAEAQLGHVLTGGNRALYFFFLLGISGPLSPSRAQRRRPQPPGSGPVRRRPAAVPPGPAAACSAPAAARRVLAPPVDKQRPKPRLSAFGASGAVRVLLRDRPPLPPAPKVEVRTLAPPRAGRLRPGISTWPRP